ncbi:proline dehydrogenase family protein [Verrucosispora sp. FIM060022]|uniref:proline dehydrogenase family protein n=1 Tax=Verrucosispora sp. FIM060022 TaxID=1479020 RepID=UPI000F8968EA|nr:proline dehydrogenase family protein [Verrucosispora sp. FIM060022]RUL94049.1 proline dehydrogenase [Verrucosispora sp. FIM060022]
MLRQVILKTAASRRARRAIEATPLTRAVVDRFVAGENVPSAVRASEGLNDAGCLATLDYLGEDTTDRAHAEHVTGQYVALLDGLADAGLTGMAEVSIKLSALGQALPREGEAVALDNASRICAAAARAGTTVTVDMEDHTTTDSTLGIVAQLRRDFPETGAVIQAYLRRSEGDCRDLATAGSRVRLCKGAYREPASVAYQARAEVTQAYLRCAEILMGGPGYPMLATHDPELIVAGTRLAAGRPGGVTGYEFQMLYGIRPAEQRRLAEAGHQVRVYVPFGEEWYGYLMRRLAERPANLMFFLRALTSRN